MRIHVVVVGSVKGPIAQLCDDYQKRASHYWKLSVSEVRAGGRSKSPDDAMAEEGERLLSRCSKATAIWLITRDGSPLSSAQLAQRLNERALHAEAEVALLIGGAFGFSGFVRDRAHARISLSGLTLPHEHARLMLLEQLYRAGTILRGEPYHKGPGS